MPCVPRPARPPNPAWASPAAPIWSTTSPSLAQAGRRPSDVSLVPAGGPLRLNLTDTARQRRAGRAGGPSRRRHRVCSWLPDPAARGSRLRLEYSTGRTLELSRAALWWGCTTRIERSREEQQLWGFHGSQRVVHHYSEQGCALVGLCLSMCEVGVRAGGVCDLYCACEGPCVGSCEPV